MKIRPILFALTLIFTLSACTQPMAAPTPTHTLVPPTPTSAPSATVTPTLPPPTETATPSPTTTASPTPTPPPTATFTPRPPNPPLIAFSMGQGNTRSIYVIAPDGTGLTQVTTDVPFAYQPLWSPDGRYLAYLSGEPREKMYISYLDYLNILDYDTGETRQLDFPGVTTFAWSPDGQQIAFTTEPETQGNHYLPTDPITGSAPYYLFGMSVADLQPAPVIELPSRMRAFGVEWLPGGDQILTLCQPAGAETYAYLYPFLGYNQATVTKEYKVLADRSKNIKYVRDIAIDPKGRQVAITRWNDADANLITLIGTKANSTALITVDEPVGSIDWSPDGTMLAYTIVPDGQSGIFVSSIWGNSLLGIAPPWKYAYNPAFSPDGAYLLYLTATQDVETMGYALNVYSFATGASTQIVPAHVSLEQPSWRP